MNRHGVSGGEGLKTSGDTVAPPACLLMAFESKALAEHGESDMADPEEKREVQIGKDILAILAALEKTVGQKIEFNHIETLATELIRMHGSSITEESKSA